MATKLSKREKVLLYVFLCLALTSALLFLLILPAAGRNLALSASRENMHFQLEEMKARMGQLEEKENRAAALKKETEALYADFFPSTVLPEELDALVTKTALEVGVAPQNLTMEMPGAAPAEETGSGGGIVYPIVINGECGYGVFVNLADAFARQPKLVLKAMTYQAVAGTFSLRLDIYTLPPLPELSAGEP